MYSVNGGDFPETELTEIAELVREEGSLARVAEATGLGDRAIHNRVRGAYRRGLLDDESLDAVVRRHKRSFPTSEEDRVDALMRSFRSPYKQMMMLAADERWRTAGHLRDHFPHSYSGGEKCPSSNLKRSIILNLIPEGLMEGLELGYNLTQPEVYFRASEEGRKLGKPAALFSAVYTAHKETPLSRLLGAEGARGDNTVMRRKILEAVAGGRRTFSGVASEVETSFRNVSNHLWNLDRDGVLDVRSLDCSKAGERKIYGWREERLHDSPEPVGNYSSELTRKVLKWVRRRGDADRERISNAFDINPANASEILRSLEEQGFLNSEFPEGGKSYIREGKLFDSFWEYALAIHDILLGGLPSNYEGAFMMARRSPENMGRVLNKAIQIYRQE